jgi:hypothetical protein
MAGCRCASSWERKYHRESSSQVGTIRRNLQSDERGCMEKRMRRESRNMWIAGGVVGAGLVAVVAWIMTWIKLE